jgi:hypothetical protein
MNAGGLGLSRALMRTMIQKLFGATQVSEIGQSPTFARTLLCFLKCSKLLIALQEETQMEPRDLMADLGVVATIVSIFFVITIFMC